MKTLSPAGVLLCGVLFCCGCGSGSGSAPAAKPAADAGKPTPRSATPDYSGQRTPAKAHSGAQASGGGSSSGTYSGSGYTSSSSGSSGNTATFGLPLPGQGPTLSGAVEKSQALERSIKVTPPNLTFPAKAVPAQKR